MDTAPIQTLGSAFYTDEGSQRTTFNDEGAGITLWLPYADWELTLAGLLAGVLRVARNPYVVYALTHALGQREDGKTFVDQLKAIVSAYITLVYGDITSYDALVTYLQQVHEASVPAQNQPEWFVECVGGSDDFTLDNTKLMESVAQALAASAAQAHRLAGLIDDEPRYCTALDNTIGDAVNVYVGAGDNGALTVDGLVATRHANAGVPLMNAAQLQAAGVGGLLADVLAAEILPGKVIGQVADGKFFGLADHDDLAVLGIAWTEADDQHLAQWCRQHGDALKALVAGEPHPDANPSNLWDVAKQRLLAPAN